MGISLSLASISFLRLFGIHLYLPGSVSEQIHDKTKVVEKCIDEYYQGEISEEKLVDGAVKGMVEALGDRYSQYYTEKEYKEIMDSIRGSYVGIGITIGQKKGENGFVIRQVMENGPAEKAGMKEGDRILSVDGTDVSSLTLDGLIDRIKSEDNKKRTLSIVVGRTDEEGQTKQLEKQVICDEVKIVSVKYQCLSDVGYIQVSEFDKETADQFEGAVENARKDEVKGLVIDVRDNGGGSLEAAIKMLDCLLPAGDLITEKSKKEGDHVYHSTDDQCFDKPVIVLVNENSASASEVFAGTLQARGAAQIVGTKSFGKGIVQTVLSLQNSCGGGVKLTTAEYFLPGGVSIHKKGLSPDVMVTNSDNGTKDMESDEQLQMALKLIRNS